MLNCNKICNNKIYTNKKSGSIRAFWGLVLTLLLVLGLAANASAMTTSELNKTVDDVAGYVYKTVAEPDFGSIGGEWAVLGLARSGYVVPNEYFAGYYARVEEYVKALNGVLHEKKYTEYSRLIVALSAIGVDATDVAGYDMTTALGDYEKTSWQGLNGPIWALIALDSMDYDMPTNAAAKTQATRQMYVDMILERQLADGGWNLSSANGVAADSDMTGMALQALAKYKGQAAVDAAIDRALVCLADIQNADGSFGSYGAATSESCAQVLTALCELGVSYDDSRFVKGGNTVLDALMKFYVKGKGFTHIIGGEINQMSTEQGFYALVAAKRLANGQCSLYEMVDAYDRTMTEAETVGDVVPDGDGALLTDGEAAEPGGVTFADVIGHKNQAAIEALAGRGIINGMGDGSFAPESGMTRAEFATIVVRALGLTPKANSAFSDVAANAWYAGFIGVASDNGIINGIGGGRFDPNAGITRQEAATMVARAAKICGIDTDIDEATANAEIAKFADHAQAEKWAVQSLAVCYKNGILDSSETKILPVSAAKRCEIAQMIYNLLEKTGK